MDLTAPPQGAEEMHEMELALNQYAAKVAKGHCADFLGYCTVSQEESTAQLTPGMWLVGRGTQPAAAKRFLATWKMPVFMRVHDKQ